MSWNYRVIKKDDEFGIHEVFYNKRGEICLISDDQIAPYGKEIEELRGDVNKMTDAFGKPVLVYDEIQFGPTDNEGDNIENDVDWNATCYPPVGVPEFTDEAHRS